MEAINLRLQSRYREIEKNEVRYEEMKTNDAEYLMVAFGTCARVCQKVVEMARAEGIKAGLLRPITLYPFPTNIINNLSNSLKSILTVEMNAGQMVEDVRLAVNGHIPVNFYGRMGNCSFS